MGALQTLFRALTPAASGPALAMLRGIQPGGIGTPPERGTQQRLESYKSHPWSRTTVGHIADGVAGVTWRLYAVGRPGERSRRDLTLQRGAYTIRKAHLEARRRAGELREITDHLFLDLVGRGNGEYTGWQLRKLLAAQYELSGEAYALIQRNSAGKPSALWGIPAHWVKSTPTPDHATFMLSWRGWQADIPTRQMLWHKDPNPADPYGRGAAMVAALADELDTDEYMAKTLRQWFYNSARPDILVTVEGATQTEVDRLERTWLDRTMGYFRKWRPMFLRGKVGIHEFDQDFRAQQMVQLRSHSQDVILQAMGFPPEVVGRLQNSNRATIVAANFLMGRYVLQPRLEAWRAFWQRFAETEYDERVIVDYDSPIDEDKDFQLDAMRAMPYAFAVDEIRALAGHPAKENGAGQVHAVPLNLQLVPGDLVAPAPLPRTPPPSPTPAPPPKGLTTADATICAKAGDLASERAILKALAGDPDDLPPLSRLASRMEPALSRAFLEAVASVGSPDLEALAAAIARGDVGAAEAAVRLTEIEQRLGQTLPPILRQGFTGGARFALDSLALEGLRFDVIDQGAVTWAGSRAGGLVVEIGAETRRTIQTLTSEALAGARDTRSTARLLRDVIGLTNRQAEAVSRFEARLRDQGAENVEARVQRYAEAQRRLRAATIARTEIQTASHQGQRALWQAGVEQGQLDPSRTLRVWIVTPDDRLDTEICEPLDGVTAGLNEAFPGGYMDPPSHPNCRCTVGLQFTR